MKRQPRCDPWRLLGVLCCAVSAVAAILGYALLGRFLLYLFGWTPPQ